MQLFSPPIYSIGANLLTNGNVASTPPVSHASRASPTAETVVRVENFARGTPMRLLRNLFVPFGAKKCRLEHNNRGKALGLVHVFFEDREKALKAAQALNGTLLNENILSCTVLDCISDVPS
jgi:RNA recognition motif-containing protein